MKFIPIPILMLAWTMVGCAKSEVTEADSDKVREEFSQENYERAMKAAGKEQELADEQSRWAAHEAAGRDSQD